MSRTFRDQLRAVGLVSEEHRAGEDDLTARRIRRDSRAVRRIEVRGREVVVEHRRMHQVAK